MAADTTLGRHDRIRKLIVIGKALSPCRRDSDRRKHKRQTAKLVETQGHDIEVVQPAPPFNPFGYSCGASTIGS
jgi:hypothetical protein